MGKVMTNKLPHNINILVIFFSVFISGCGQSGPLYLPPPVAPSANVKVPVTVASQTHSLNNAPIAQSNHTVTMTNETTNSSPLSTNT